ncbi:hypothetical protein HYU22_03355 [Candidatus Woesearchaeota archaeon]|nr:hypothetical protein [Candidatus Woesearchaeota archaeon]
MPVGGKSPCHSRRTHSKEFQLYDAKQIRFSEFEFLVLFHYLLKFIKIISLEEILQQWNEAKNVMEQIDPEDVTIIAAALSQDNSVIWSDDAHFDQQKKVFILKTKDMLYLSQ